MPLPQMTTQRWMLAVAISACVFAARMHWRNAVLRESYLARAEVAASHRAEYVEKAERSRRRADEIARQQVMLEDDPKFSPKFRELMERDRQATLRIAKTCDGLAGYDAIIVDKYRAAADRPWAPVPPDPPPPE